MAENSAIEWTDHTFNPWTGCTKVSPGCAHCYAESWAKRSGTVQWGPGKPRRRTKTWGDPVKWNAAENNALVSHSEFTNPRRPRVFSASLADWLDDEVPIEWFADLLVLIATTPNLDWLLLTKRPQNFAKRTIEASDLTDHPGSSYATQWGGFGRIPNNVWIGTTVENQEMADLRIPQLIQIPARIRFLSCEPLIGPVVLPTHLGKIDGPGLISHGYLNDWIHWVIAGGESGPSARSMHPDWARSLRDQCSAANVPFLFKQWGEWLPGSQNNTEHLGGDVHDWPDEFATKIGKKAAGRHLDVQLHSEFPHP